jgi:hypothetical protein
MTTITGTFKNSGQVAIAAGVLRVQLNAPLADASTSPDSYLLTLPHDFAITNGVLEPCNLKESETEQISYTFTVYQTFTDYDYYYAGSGEFYGRNTDRPTHLWTDSNYYSGVAHSTESVPLERVARTRLEAIGDAFQAIVPNQSSIDFAQLERTGFATDRAPQTARQVAQVLKQDSLFMQALIDFLVSQPYDNTKPYRRGNIVSLAGSSYQCLIDNTVGQPPASSPSDWRLLASKGDPGGTGGNDVAYDEAIWNGATWAPSANALRDKIETLASAGDLGDKPSFEELDNAITNRFENTELTGTPTAPTPVSADNSTLIATTAFVKAATNRYSRIVDSKTAGTTGGTAASGNQTRTLNNIAANSGDVVTLTSNTFTLRPGTYRIGVSAPALGVGANRISLWNVGNSTRVATGASSYSNPANGDQVRALLNAHFTIAANTDLQIQHHCQSANATNGLGIAINDGGSEIYTVVELWRVD